MIYGYKHANFWCNRDDYGLKRRVTVSKLKNSGVSYSHLDILDYEDEKKVIKEIDRDREVKLEDVWGAPLKVDSKLRNKKK